MIDTLLLAVFIVSQVLYLLSFIVDGYLFTRPVNRVDPAEIAAVRDEDCPFIVLFYPVLNELEGTMRTTMTSLAHIDYPRDRYRVYAIPNAADRATVASLKRLQDEFPFLDIIEVPPTGDSRWDAVWRAWDRNPKAYWWHRGPRAYNRNLPPKKTRQLIYAFYRTAETLGTDFLVNYIDADSAPPTDHFRAGAAGMRRFDVLQATNVAGNLNMSMAATWHSFDHMSWDGRKYAHLTANGRHPFWVLGKGLFFRASDLVALGGFHPWITIEDPEVGLRFWKNGKRLGLIDSPLIEEVPETIGQGITQRRRWVCGFFQTLDEPLDAMGFTAIEKLKAWTNFLPCLALWLNAVGIPIGIWAIARYFGGDPMPAWLAGLAMINMALYALSLVMLYQAAWTRTALVLDRTRDRIFYMLRINPLSLMLWWLIWTIPLWKGWRMYRRDDGLVWERTEKINANEELVQGIFSVRLPAVSVQPRRDWAAHTPMPAPRELEQLSS